MLRSLIVTLSLASPALANGFAAGEIVDWPMAMITEGIQAFPANEEEGRPQTALVLRRNNQGHTVAQYTESGFADDSVEGERHTYVLERLEDGRMKILETKTEYRCYRGENAKKWQSGLCP